MSDLKLCVDWKTKYLPSRVHAPQHSAGGSFQPVSKARRPDPSLLTSQSEVAFVCGSVTVNRNKFPSGDQRIQEGVPFRFTSGREPVPLVFTPKRARRLAYRTLSPSGNQAASVEATSFIRCPGPETVGITQSGPRQR